MGWLKNFDNKRSLKKLEKIAVKVENLADKYANMSDDECDLATRQFIDWYISEQVEEEANARNILKKLKMFGDEKASLYHLDKELSKREYKSHKYRE